MIVELAIASAAVAVASAIARAVVSRRTQRESERSKRAADALATLDARRGLRVGDVLLHVGDELWLAGLVELDEEGSIVSLFRTPENTRASWVVQLDGVGRELGLFAESNEVPEGTVPDRLPIGGRLLSLRRRGRAHVRTEGEHLPKVGVSARFTILEDAGGRVAIVVDAEASPRLVLVGDRVDRALFDLLPGGDVKR